MEGAIRYRLTRPSDKRVVLLRKRTSATRPSIRRHRLRLSASASDPPRKQRAFPVRTRAVVEMRPGNGIALKPAEKFVTSDAETLANDVIEKLEFFCGGHRDEMTKKAAYNGAAWSVREYLFDRLRRTMDAWKCHPPTISHFRDAVFQGTRSKDDQLLVSRVFDGKIPVECDTQLGIGIALFGSCEEARK